MTKSIRLLSIVTRMNVGGPAVQISTLMRGLIPTDVEQVLLTGTVGSDEEDFLASQGQDLRFIRVPSMGREVHPVKDALALRQISKFIRQFNPHIVHTHTAKAGSLGRVAAIATRSGAKRVHTFHGHLLHGYFSPNATQRVIRVERALAERTTKLIAVGEQVKTDLLREGIGQIDQYEVIPPGLQLGRLPTKVQAREGLGLDPDQLVVCFIGRLTAIKRIDRLIEVVRHTSRKIPNVRFIVAGEGNELELVHKARQEGLPVIALGWRSDVERIMAASDLMVLTSDNEGTPVSLIQAGLAGLPVVSTDVGSVRDVVQDGKSGILTSTDPLAISTAVSNMLANPQLRRQYGDFARQDYSERYGSLTLVNSHLRVYRSLLNES